MTDIFAGQRERRLARYDSLIRLLNALPGTDFGGHPECAETDPDVFFPLTDHMSHQIRVAKSICQRCEVQGSCLQHAMNNGERGIWGGTTESERRALRRARLEAARAAEQQPEVEGDVRTRGVA